MKRANWALARYPGASRDVIELDELRLRWLCGCGRWKQFKRSKAFPICRCGRRMRMLDHPALGYA